MHLPRPRHLAFLLVTLLTLGVVLAPAVTAAPTSVGVTGLPPFAAPPAWLGTCRDVRLPVTLAGGQAETLVAHRCEPRHGRPDTVLVLVHGATYDAAYWSWPQDPAVHSFTWAALAAGYAVLAVDRLGQGASSRPASALDTFPAQALTLHQVAQTARRDFRRVVFVGHSFGSAEVSQDLATWSRDADAVILTGSGHQVSNATNALSHAGFAPAADLDPRFASLAADPGYETSTTLTVRTNLLYNPAASSTRVRAYDQATRDTLSLSELTTRPASLTALTRTLRIPTLLLDGQVDSHYCDGAQAPSPPETGLDDCTTGTTLYASERANYGPCLAAAVVPGSGHDLTTENGASVAATLALTWLRATAPTNEDAARCVAVGAWPSRHGDDNGGGVR